MLHQAHQIQNDLFNAFNIALYYSGVLFRTVRSVEHVHCSVSKVRMFDRSLPIRKLLFRGERDKEKSLDCNICPVLKMSTGSLFFMFLKLEKFEKG